MTIALLLNQPVTVIPRTVSGTADEYGNKAYVDGVPITTVGYIEQTDATEVTVDRATFITNWLIFLPAGTPVTAASLVLFEEKRFELIGSPASVWNPRLRQTSHIECRAIETTG